MTLKLRSYIDWNAKLNNLTNDMNQTAKDVIKTIKETTMHL